MAESIIHTHLGVMHKHLMMLGFPYPSVSVIYRVDKGNHVVIDKDEKHRVTEELQLKFEADGFGHSFIEIKSKHWSDDKCREINSRI